MPTLKTPTNQAQPLENKSIGFLPTENGHQVTPNGVRQLAQAGNRSRLRGIAAAGWGSEGHTPHQMSHPPKKNTCRLVYCFCLFFFGGGGRGKYSTSAGSFL